ncbi:hypothetical protein LINPERPRIM_LOCUS40622 [Linum perenne]
MVPVKPAGVQDSSKPTSERN